MDWIRKGLLKVSAARFYSWSGMQAKTAMSLMSFSRFGFFMLELEIFILLILYDKCIL